MLLLPMSESHAVKLRESQVLDSSGLGLRTTILQIVDATTASCNLGVLRLFVVELSWENMHRTDDMTSGVNLRFLWTSTADHNLPTSFRIWQQVFNSLKTRYRQEAQLMLTNRRDAFRGQSRSPNTVPSIC